MKYLHGLLTGSLFNLGFFIAFVGFLNVHSDEFYFASISTSEAVWTNLSLLGAVVGTVAFFFLWIAVDLKSFLHFVLAGVGMALLCGTGVFVAFPVFVLLTTSIMEQSIDWPTLVGILVPLIGMLPFVMVALLEDL